jgi:hypothetical protein
MKNHESWRKLFLITSLAGLGLLFNSCVTGYVETEPSYVVMVRPAQPSNVHIWIDGDWRWNSQSQRYVQNTGYWEKPRQSQTYVSGYWQSAPKGKYWQNGHWQNNGNQKNNGYQKNNDNQKNNKNHK